MVKRRADFSLQIKKFFPSFRYLGYFKVSCVTNADENMNILILTDFFPNETVPYEANFIGEMVKRLANRHHAALLVPQVLYPPIHRYRILKRRISPHFIEEHYGIKAIVLRYPHIPVAGEWFMPYIALMPLRQAVQRHFPDTDIIHAHWAYRSGFWGAWLARWLKVPLILTVHGSDANLWLQDRKKRRKIRFALRQADGIIVASQYLEQKIRPFAPQARIATICGGFDPDRFRPSATSSPEISSRSMARLLCIANFYPVKGIDRLIRAAHILHKENRSFHLTIIGDGPEKIKCEKLIKSLGLREIIRLEGGKPHPQIPAYLAGADFLVIPSLEEGIPIVMLEALAMGVPVIGTPVGKMPELLASGEYGILAGSSNPEDLAAAIATALQKKFDRAKIAAFARQFSWDHVTIKVESFYKNILSDFYVAGKK
jgi:glycosyltransferase involved in cell wall biosynthesis